MKTLRIEIEPELVAFLLGVVLGSSTAALIFLALS